MIATYVLTFVILHIVLSVCNMFFIPIYGLYICSYYLLFVINNIFVNLRAYLSLSIWCGLPGVCTII